MKSKFKHIFRVAVCLVLVCCLTVNISPIRAEATGSGLAATFAAVPIPAKLAIATAVICVGVYAGTQTDALDTIVTGAQSLAVDAGYIVNDMINVVKYVDPEGNVQWLFPLQFLEVVRDALWTNGTIQYSCDFQMSHIIDYWNGTGVTMSNNQPFVPICIAQPISGNYGYENPHCMHIYSLIDYSSVLGSGTYGLYLYASVSAGTLTSLSSNIRVYIVDDLSTFSADDFCADVSSGKISLDPISTPYDLTLGEVGTADQTVSEAFPTWAAGAVTVPGTTVGSDTDEEWIPVGLPSDYESALSKTQSDVQSGVSEYVDTGGDLTPDNDDDNQPTGTTMADITVTAFLAKLLADITNVLYGTGTQTLTELFGSTWTELQALGQTITENATALKTELATGFQTLSQNLTASLTDIFNAVKELPALMAEAFEYFFDCLLEGIQLLPEAMGKVLTDLFVPSQDFVQTKVESMLGNFPFIGNIIETGTYIRDSFTGASGPPVIYVDLSAADGDIDYGEKTLLTDFSWYAPYKGTVDTILGSALWAFFGWRVFLRLPGLISGAEGYVGEFRTRYDAYSRKRKED